MSITEECSEPTDPALSLTETCVPGCVACVRVLVRAHVCVAVQRTILLRIRPSLQCLSSMVA